MTEGQTVGLGSRFGGKKEWEKAGEEYTKPSKPSDGRKRYRNRIYFEILLRFWLIKQTFKGFMLFCHV